MFIFEYLSGYDEQLVAQRGSNYPGHSNLSQTFHMSCLVSSNQGDKDKGLGTDKDNQGDKDKGLGTDKDKQGDKDKGLGTDKDKQGVTDMGLSTDKDDQRTEGQEKRHFICNV